MAKIKVHELAKELDIQSKDVLTFLQEKGVEAKAPQSSVEDTVADMVRKKYSAGAAGKPNNQGAAPQTRVEQTDSVTPETKNNDTQGDQPKKKKIIFVSNPHNSKISGSKPQGGGQPSGQNRQKQGGQGSNNAGNSYQAQQHRAPIKPLTPPSPTPSVQMVPNRPTQAKPTQSVSEETNVGGTQSVQNVQNREQQPTVPAQERPNAGRTDGAPRADRPQHTDGYQRTDRPQNTGGYQGTDRPQRTGGYQGTDRPQRTGGYQGTDRPQRTGGYQGTDRPQRTGGYQGTDRPQRTGGYQGTDRPQRTDGYQRNDGGERRSYGQGQGQGQSQGQGGRYNGNRDNRAPGQYQGQDRRNDGNSRPGYNNQGGYRGASSNEGGNRPYNNANSDQRRTGAPGDRFKKAAPGQTQARGFVTETPIKDNEKKNGEEKRRFSQEKDKRSKKDMIYEDEQVKAKPGRFIKPEKKKEEIVEEVIKVIELPDVITIKELAEKMKMQPSAIVKKLFLQGRIVTVNQEITWEDAENIAMEYDILCEREVKVDVIEELLKEDVETEEEMVSRPPVICVMGHVDHGKTSLLDAIRKTNVTDKEAGGITQHIGAYTVQTGGKKITFLDTPGHEAFTAMRMRGANATDIAILVVAADDGVMPQTVEAINHAKAAGIEIIVAVNKIDKPSANIDRVKQELTEYELISVDWGGSTEFVPVSAKTGEGIDTLLETILLTSEILELKANPNRHARGLVIEAELDKGRGSVATILVQKGTLHVGDFISAGASYGKVRAMIDDKGRQVKEAGPSTPVEILGLSDVPSAGEVFLSHENDKKAKTYAETYLAQNKERMLEDTKARMSLDDLFTQIQEGNLKELNLIVKADVQGSVEAVKQSLTKLSNEEVVVKCIHGGVGAINDSDVMLASASSAIIIGFNVRPDVTAKVTAEREGVDVRLYKVIYQAIEDIEAAMKGMLDPVFEEKVIGHAEVRQIFKASSIGNIAGSYVLDGHFVRNCKVRITREGNQIFEGELSSLKRFKDDVKEVKEGFECGLVFNGFDQIQEFDIVEAYIMVEVPR